MAGTDIAPLNSRELVRLYRTGGLSPVEVARDVLARIEEAAAFNAFMPLRAELTIEMARASEARWKAGSPLSEIDGVPATVKDNIVAKDWPTRRGSRTTSDKPADYDAPAVARLREAGAVIVGKTALPEHGWIGVCHSPLTGITRNPWDAQRTPGGSTGGGAVAALLGLGRLHLGTDGAGSLRIPAAFTGVVGMKPTVGTVPVYPASPLGDLSHHGPVAASVEEAAQVLSFITKPDQRDLRAVQGPDHPRAFDHEAGVRGVRVAYVARFGGHAVDPEVAAITGRAADILTGQGAIITEETLNIGEQARNIIRPLWWSAARAIVSAVPEELQDQIDPGLRRIAEAGWKFTAADYIGAMVARSDLYGAILGFMQRYDLIISPAMPIPAFEAGLEAPREGYGDDWIEWSPYTYPFNLTGQPAASVPCGLTSGGLPVGLQIVGSRYGDELVLRAAHAIERDRLMPAFIAGKTS